MKVMAETKNKITPWENYDYTPKILDIWEVIGVVGGMVTFKARLKMNARPYTTRQHYTVLFGLMLTGYLVGKTGVIFRDYAARRRQLYVEDYVEKHPDDFTVARPLKYKDVLLDWEPHR